jgi:hypothetical protein
MRLMRSMALFLVLAAPLTAADAAKPNPSWEKMKSLVGSWKGMEGNMPVSVTYTLVSNGTSLMESLTAEHDTNMVTMYSPDGDTILATHYCAAGNQPRMRAKASGDTKSLDFQFVDASNVQGSTGEVMQRLVVTFQGPDHFQQAWTAQSNGKEHTSDFVYTRNK